MKRVIVIGNSGSGKTTLARELARKLGVPHIETDSIFHQPNWTEMPAPEFRKKMDELTEAEQWVLDGNYYRFLGDIVWPKADTIIWLDYHIIVVLWRVVTRTFSRLVRRVELWNGNRELLRMIFSRESIILWSLNMHHEYRSRYTHRTSGPIARRAQMLHLKSPRETSEWLKSL